MVVKIIEKTFRYCYKEDKLTLIRIDTRYVETSVREGMDLIMEVNSTMTEGETLLELSSGNCTMVTCYAVPVV